MEQDRAPNVLLHQHELERGAAGKLRDGSEHDQRHENKEGVTGEGGSRPGTIRDRGQDQRLTDERTEPPAASPKPGVELLHSSPKRSIKTFLIVNVNLR